MNIDYKKEIQNRIFNTLKGMAFGDICTKALKITLMQLRVDKLVINDVIKDNIFMLPGTIHAVDIKGTFKF